MNLIVVLFCILVGSGLTVLGRRLYRRARPEPTCSWCTAASGWAVTGHNSRECRGYGAGVRAGDPQLASNASRDSDTY
ncbi:hypothetical protein ABT039_22865 [Streptomyces lasiicapitis]|uniref:hypothetical protein n=1 Tax=Streptomyces lasiicapitis TaxID=1923961 RepID=UPI003323742E